MRTLIVATGILSLAVSVAAAGRRAAPQDALGPPEGAGLVIVAVDADVSRGLQIARGGLQNLRGYLRWDGDVPGLIEGRESSGLLVFTGLRPGPYTLVGIEAVVQSSNEKRPISVQLPPDLPGLATNVTAGVPAYLGRLTIVDRQRMIRIGKPSPPKVDFDPDPARAGEAWTVFLRAHAQTAWAPRVRAHLAGGATTAAAPVAPASMTPLERVEALVREGEEAEQNGTVRHFRETRAAAIAGAEAELAAHVAVHPDDTRALLAQVRLGWLRESTNEVRLEVTPGADVTGPDAGFAALEATVERVLAAEPSNAEAYFWKARLAGVELPALREGVFLRVPRDLPKAVAGARRAVELAPANVGYRAMLATFLVADQRPDEALEAVRDLTGPGGAPHPIASLLLAWKALPLPAGATEQPMMARGFTDQQVDRGRITSYANMRVRMFTVPVRASVVEAFYKTHWKHFRLFRKDSERNGAERMTGFAQFFRWSGGRLEPVTSERQVDAAEDDSSPSDGLLLMVTEFLNVPPENRARFSGVTGEAFCALTLMSTIAMNAR